MLQPSIGFLVYELDFTCGCRTLRGGLHLLPGPCQISRRHRMVVLDGRFPRVHVCQHGPVGQGHADDAAGDGLPRLDGHRRRRDGHHGHLRFSRAGHVLAAVLYRDTHRIGDRTEDIIIVWNNNSER